MNEKPILFTEEMIKAIMAGEKWQTRRIMNPQPFFNYSMQGWVWKPTKKDAWYNQGDGFDIKMGNVSPYCSFEDPNYLWVREKHIIECPYGPPAGCDNPDHVIYWAAEEPMVRDSIPGKWRTSIFMPRWASRLRLVVRSVIPEQVQQMGEAEARAEGCINLSDFKALWDKINGKRGFSWQKNPWVWAIQFDVEGAENASYR